MRKKLKVGEKGYTLCGDHGRKADFSPLFALYLMCPFPWILCTEQGISILLILSIFFHINDIFFSFTLFNVTHPLIYISEYAILCALFIN